VDDAVRLLGALADDARLKVFAALVLGAGSVAEVAARAGLAPKEASKALTRLGAAGLAERRAQGWTATPDVLRAAVVAAAPVLEPEDHGVANPEAAAVLRTFLRAGRLVSIPTARGKRLLVLDHIAHVFEPGIRYPEREVDTLLRAFHEDHAALRRYLIDEGLLSRERGEYWRTGGTVDV